ncbi:MAG: SDR family oxidoreductase [Chloroflexaceae bacterium]|jgi:NAD(P)-dependent dehydrogenase (short-subunit alcohol dehydrogenase family)|nr:SDR family oxidoreductase [Chloroflexaceae bacterium]
MSATRFDIRGQVAVVTGGSGVLGSAMAHGLAAAGAAVAVLGRRLAPAESVAEAIRAVGGSAMAIAADVCDREALRHAAAQIEANFGPVDMLVNGAGGNRPGARTSPDTSFFDLDPLALREVVELNFDGTLAACQMFGRGMAERGRGCIVNISSMSAMRPLSRVVGYGAAKAAVDNFTRWLAVDMARNYSAAIRVNAIAPGFFLTEQNRDLLTEPSSGRLTPRGETILAHTPMGRFGQADDLVGTLLWLVSPAAAFVTGVVVPVDGGFSADSGV